MQKHEKPIRRLPGRHTLQGNIFQNGGLISEIEQNILRRSSVAIAGVGGVGGLLAERLIRIGIVELK